MKKTTRWAVSALCSLLLVSIISSWQILFNWGIPYFQKNKDLKLVLVLVLAFLFITVCFYVLGSNIGKMVGASNAHISDPDRLKKVRKQRKITLTGISVLLIIGVASAFWVKLDPYRVNDTIESELKAELSTITSRVIKYEGKYNVSVNIDETYSNEDFEKACQKAVDIVSKEVPLEKLDSLSIEMNIDEMQSVNYSTKNYEDGNLFFMYGKAGRAKGDLLESDIEISEIAARLNY